MRLVATEAQRTQNEGAPVRLGGLRAPAANASTIALAALLALTLFRLVIAASVPLVPDEAYYWVWSRALAAGYPDHPPMVALWVRIGTLIAGDGSLGVRLLGPLSVAIASLLLADAADRLLPGRNAGIRAAALMNATLSFGVGGVLMTPDAPLLAFWIACLWALARLLSSGDQRWWPAIGLFAGLAMDSKYTAGLLWLGIAAWLLASPAARAWLRRPGPWLGAVVALALFLPVVLWDARHGWPSFARQGGRIADWHPSQAMHFLAELFGGQVGLATPLIFAFCLAGVIEIARQTWRNRDPAWTLLAALTLPSIALFIQHALGDRVQGNWPAVIYPAAAIAAGSLRSRIWQGLWVPAIALGFGITLLVYLQATRHVLPLPVRDDPLARQLDGWDTLASEINAERLRVGADFIAADQYGVASQLARELPPGVTVVGTEPRWRLLDLPRANLAGQAGILVRSGSGGTSWNNPAEIGTAARRQGSETVETLVLYRVFATRDAPDAVTLPRP